MRRRRFSVIRGHLKDTRIIFNMIPRLFNISNYALIRLKIMTTDVALLFCNENRTYVTLVSLGKYGEDLS